MLTKSKISSVTLTIRGYVFTARVNAVDELYVMLSGESETRSEDAAVEMIFAAARARLGVTMAIES